MSNKSGKKENLRLRLFKTLNFLDLIKFLKHSPGAANQSNIFSNLKRELNENYK